jgi:hypothetical protein
VGRSKLERAILRGRALIRTAACRCGRLTARCEGEPVRVSVCQCLECQRRTGSAFSAQARWPHAQVTLAGEHREWSRRGESGGEIRYRFCPSCGSTVAYVNDTSPGLTAVPLGAFADPDFPPPRFSVWERRQHAWTAILGDVEHTD